jgi:hypothetical protein
MLDGVKGSKSIMIHPFEISMFLQNFGINLQNYMAPKPKTTPTPYSMLIFPVLFVFMRTNSMAPEHKDS